MHLGNENWTFIDKAGRSGLLLDDGDSCYYYLIRTAGGYSASEANSRIANFKKEPERFRDNCIVWGYKVREIDRFADDIAAFLIYGNISDIVSLFGDAAIVPMPTSKPKSHPHYDDRLAQLCKLVSEKVPDVFFEDPFDMREAVTPSHKHGIRDVVYLKERILFNCMNSAPNVVILVDDVLTTGAHFVACKEIIEEHNPGTITIGLFLARHIGDQ